MVKVQAIIDFNYKNYNKIKDLQPTNKTQEGKIFAEDIFNVEDEEALYLTGKNKNNIIAVKVLEVIPEIKEEKRLYKKQRIKITKRKEQNNMNDRAKYVAVNEEKNNRIQHIRECFSLIYDEIDLKCKPSRETSLALTKLEKAQFWAIKGVTREK